MPLGAVVTRGFHRKTKPDNWPEHHHLCDGPTCTFPNPPKSVAGRYNCLGCTKDGIHCRGEFVVSESKAARNHRNERKQMREMYSKKNVKVQQYDDKFFKQFDHPKPQHERRPPLRQPSRPIGPLVLPSMLDATPDNVSEFMRSLSPTRRAPAPPKDYDAFSQASTYTAGPPTPGSSRSGSPTIRGRSMAPRPLADVVDPRSIPSDAMAASAPARYHTTSRQQEAGGHGPASRPHASSPLDAQREFHMHRAMSPPPAPGTPVKAAGFAFMTTSRQLPTARTVYGHKHGAAPVMTMSTPAPTRPDGGAFSHSKASAARHGHSFSHWNPMSSTSSRDNPTHTSSTRNPQSGRTPATVTGASRHAASSRDATPPSTSRPAVSVPRHGQGGSLRGREVAKPLPPLPSGHKASSSDPTPLSLRSHHKSRPSARPMSPERFAAKPLSNGTRYNFH
ncbi:hypothetical protein HDZ31DRAFT_85545 [Schizophyllum fasciatum]